VGTHRAQGIWTEVVVEAEAGILVAANHSARAMAAVALGAATELGQTDAPWYPTIASEFPDSVGQSNLHSRYHPRKEALNNGRSAFHIDGRP